MYIHISLSFTPGSLSNVSRTPMQTGTIPITITIGSTFKWSSRVLGALNFNTKRHYVSRTNTKNNSDSSLCFPQDKTVTVMDHPTPSLQREQDSLYFKTLPYHTRVSLLLIGVCSLNKLTLSLSTRLFPFLPLPLMKWLVSSIYCGGQTMAEVVQCGRSLQRRGISNMMLSLTMENSEGDKPTSAKKVQSIVDTTIDSIYQVLKPNLLSQLESARDVNDIAPGYVALKPSALVVDPGTVLANFNKSESACLIANCERIIDHVQELNRQLHKRFPSRQAPFFLATIDAEKYQWQINGVYKLQRYLMNKYNTHQDPLISVVGTWQLYLRDSPQHLQTDLALAKKNHYKLGLKLVRGAYLHSEPHREQTIFRDKTLTDHNFNKITESIINDMIRNKHHSHYAHLVVASHNTHSLQAVATILNTLKKKHADPTFHTHTLANVTLGQLLGMADPQAHQLILHFQMTNLIKYVPWGPPRETRDYLLRRLQENGDAVRSDNGVALIKQIFKSFK